MAWTRFKNEHSERINKKINTYITELTLIFVVFLTFFLFMIKIFPENSTQEFLSENTIIWILFLRVFIGYLRLKEDVNILKTSTESRMNRNYVFFFNAWTKFREFFSCFADGRFLVAKRNYLFCSLLFAHDIYPHIFRDISKN